MFHRQNQSCVQSRGFYGQYRPRVHTGSYWRQSQIVDIERVHYYRKNGVKNGKSEQYTTIATNQICFQNKKSTNQRQKKRKSKTSEVQQGSQTALIADRVTNSTNQQSSVGLTTTHHVTTCDHSQNSPTNKPVSIENQDTSLPLLRVFKKKNLFHNLFIEWGHFIIIKVTMCSRSLWVWFLNPS